MQDHSDVRNACAATHNIASSTGVDQERVAIIRSATDAELLDSMTKIASGVRHTDEEFPVFSAVGQEELLARMAVAALVLRERRMSKRLNADVKTNFGGYYRAVVADTGALIAEKDNYLACDTMGRRHSRMFGVRVQVLDPAGNLMGDFRYNGDELVDTED